MKGVSLVSYHHLFSTQSPFHRHHHHHHRSLTPPHKHLRVVYTTHPTCSFRLKSSENENDSTTHLLKPDDTVSSSQSESGPASFVQRSLSFLRDGFKLDEIGGEIVSIALPAVLALAADPLTSLVDTAFVGHLGSVELAAVGVSASVFNLVSKLFNVPLLNVTTAFVAEEQAFITKGGDKPLYSGQNGLRSKKVLPSVSTSLILAATIGIAEAVALSAGSGFLMNTMGIPFDSPMRVPAEQFLTLRAFGAPPIVIALAAQGAFRGFKDTKTPLYAVGAGNLLNALLDPILIFFLSFGIGGAAISTVISEYVDDVVLDCLYPLVEIK